MANIIVMATDREYSVGREGGVSPSTARDRSSTLALARPRPRTHAMAFKRPNTSDITVTRFDEKACRKAFPTVDWACSIPGTPGPTCTTRNAPQCDFRKHVIFLPANQLGALTDYWLVFCEVRNGICMTYRRRNLLVPRGFRDDPS